MGRYRLNDTGDDSGAVRALASDDRVIQIDGKVLKAVIFLLGLAGGGGGATYLHQPSNELLNRVDRLERRVQEQETTINGKLDLLDRRITVIIENQQRLEARRR